MLRIITAFSLLMALAQPTLACSWPNLTPDGCEVYNGVVNPACGLTDWHDSLFGNNWYRTDNNFPPGGVCIGTKDNPTNIGGVSFVAGHFCLPDFTNQHPEQADDQVPSFPCQNWIPDAGPAESYVASGWAFNVNIVSGAAGEAACSVTTMDTTATASPVVMGTWANGTINASAAGQTWTSTDSGDFWGPWKGRLTKGHRYTAFLSCYGPAGSYVTVQGINGGEQPR